MGSRLDIAIIVIAGFVLSPLGEAFAQRASTPQARQEAKLKPVTAPSRAEIPPTSSLSLSGTYVLTSLNGRLVRDVELAKSKVTFRPGGEVSVDVGCNGFGTTLIARAKPNQILGFRQQSSTLIGCPPDEARAEAAISQLFIQTANIARAGNTMTFFNVEGINIAQWTAAPSPQPKQGPQPKEGPQLTNESRAPQPAAAPPHNLVRVNFGDYVLTELNGNAGQNAPRPSGAISGQPTFFLRENGQVTGSSGCNQFNSALVLNSDGSTRFGPVVTTKKACLNPTIRATEIAFFTAMRRAVRVDVSASQVTLFGPNGQPSARLGAIGARAEAAPRLYDKTWVLRRLNGAIVSQPDPPTIVFRGNRASGSTGCGNQFDLDHNRQNGQSRFTNAIMTEMGCGDRRRNDLQIHYVAQLERVTIIDVTSTTLRLRSADNTTNMVFNAP